MKMKRTLLAGLLIVSAAPIANADALFDTSSSFQVVGTNAPSSFTQTVTQVPGTYSLDAGALSLTLSIVSGSGGAEWLVFNYITTNGGPISQPGQNFEIHENGNVAAQPLNFIGFYTQFSSNGTALTPTSSFFGGQPIGSNPVPGEAGSGWLVTGLSDPVAQGPFNIGETVIDPFSQLAPALGNTALPINGYELALEFAPQLAAVPEASTWVMMILGFVGIGFIGYRRTPSAAIGGAA
jgi:hypothetical protein